MAKSSKNTTALMMYAASEHDADLYYAVRCSVPDPFLYFRIAGRSSVLMSDLEYERVRKAARVDQVELYSEWSTRTRTWKVPKPTQPDVAAAYLKDHGVRKVVVPSHFPLGFAELLRVRGIRVEPKNDPFWEERVLKTREEVALIRQALRHTEKAIHKAEDLLKRSVIRGKRVLYKGVTVTSDLSSASSTGP